MGKGLGVIPETLHQLNILAVCLDRVRLAELNKLISLEGV